tara:strand:+ start:151 stop:507 length:357 start_codon:yes stop_codon:yes gene_type:complete
MTLGELKIFIENQEKQTFDFGLSLPFSWRGSYAEVAFSILKEQTSKVDLLKSVDDALSETFIGYKGGDFNYDLHTDVNFEMDYSAYSDGGYCRQLIAEIECSEPYETEEQKLVKIAFS